MEVKRCTWHKSSVIYEIYPASFTTEGLQGIIQKLEYIKEMGIQAIWLCPIFKSPFMDSGYDTQDYYQVNETFGSISDVEELVDKAHKLGIKVILDIALNHTSNQHEWFVEACKSKNSKYRDYYIFREGNQAEYPNNWVSSKTRKSVWTYNKETDDYYLHIYTKYQPDLNWENEKLRMEIYNILEFWLEKGIDGFRLDVINKIAKPKGIKDIVSNHKYSDYLYENHELSHVYIKEMREKVFNKYEEVLMLGQTSGVTVQQGLDYGSSKHEELDLFLQFDHMDLKPVNKVMLQRLMMRWQNIDVDGAWPTVFMGSHDSSRMVNHFATDDEKYQVISAKMLCALQLCLKGTQIIYMGDELALTNVNNSHIDEFIDIRSKDIYDSRIKEGKTEEEIINELNHITRDNARRQIPWAKAEDMLVDDESVLTFYKNILSWRKNEKAILYGRTVNMFNEHVSIFAYKRVYGDVEIFVVANMSSEEVSFEDSSYGEKVISNYLIDSQKGLFPFQIKVYKKQV